MGRWRCVGRSSVMCGEVEECDVHVEGLWSLACRGNVADDAGLEEAIQKWGYFNPFYG